MTRHRNRTKQLSILAIAALFVASCNSSELTSTTPATSTLAAADAAEPADPTTVANNPASDSEERNRPPVLRPGPVPARPNWAGPALSLQTDDILDVTIVPEDSVSPDETNEWALRVFADSDDEAIDALITAMDNLGVPVEPAVFVCPYSAENFDTVIDYLESFEWSDDEGRSLRSPRLGPNMGEIGRAGWGYCSISFPLEVVSKAEVDRIKEFAVEQRVEWIDFWAGPTGEMFEDPLGLPPGGLPYIQVPHACPETGCVGDEAGPDFFD